MLPGVQRDVVRPGLTWLGGHRGYRVAKSGESTISGSGW